MSKQYASFERQLFTFGRFWESDWVLRRMGLFVHYPLSAEKRSDLGSQGATTPFLMRDAPGDSSFQVLGEAYVDGHMNRDVTEDVSRGKRQVRKLCLV